MRMRRILGTALENLRQRRLRTSLTTLGVVIGITAVIGLASLGEGFRLNIKTRLQSGFELDNLTVIPGSLFAGYSREGFKDEDVQNISRISGVKFSTGILQIGNATLFNGEKTVQAFVATAVNFSEFVQVFPDRFSFESGTIPESDRNDTMVIGYKVNHPVENDTTPFAIENDNVTVSLDVPWATFPYHRSVNQTFTVAGTLQKEGAAGITNFDYWIFMPLEKARKLYDKADSDDLIFVKIYNPEESDRIAKDIESLFPPYRVTILTPLMFIKQVDNILTLVQLFLLAIASISLVVAGIGIMNIMMVSVMERTREIGILKAVGAKNRTILGMFLAEAILIGLIGGLVGVLAGYGLSYALGLALSNLIPQEQSIIRAFTRSPQTTQRLTITPVFSTEWTVIAFVFAVFVCIVFGLYPARKASKLNPVEALRYE